MYLQKGISVKIIFCYAFKVTDEKSRIHIWIQSGSSSGSVSHKYGSEDPDPDPYQNRIQSGSSSGSVSHKYGSEDPDPYQNVTDPSRTLLTTVKRRIPQKLYFLLQ
jgi:hypothetical protein